MPIDTATITSMTIRIDTVLAALKQYIKVNYLKITELDLISKACDWYKMDVLIINEIDFQDLMYKMVFLISNWFDIDICIYVGYTWEEGIYINKGLTLLIIILNQH